MQKTSFILFGLTALVAVGVAAPRFTRAQDSSVHATPRQIMIKFEWIKVGSDGPAATKEVDALTLLTEEDKSAQAVSATSLNGAVNKKTVRLVSRVAAGDIVAIDIAEETQKTDKSGQTKTDATTTQVRIKSGDTCVVKGQMTKRRGHSSESLLFVTPTLVKSR